MSVRVELLEKGSQWASRYKPSEPLTREMRRHARRCSSNAGSAIASNSPTPGLVYSQSRFRLVVKTILTPEREYEKSFLWLDAKPGFRQRPSMIDRRRVNGVDQH